MNKFQQVPNLPPLDPSDQEIYAHLIAAFLAFRRWRRGGVSVIDLSALPERPARKEAAT